MTLDEKVNITRGFKSLNNACHGSTGSVPRLGWPGMCLQDAGNGLRGVDLTNSYPSGIHVGASWDKNLTYRRGLEMGNEFRIKGGELPVPLQVSAGILEGETDTDILHSQYCLGPGSWPTGQDCSRWSKLGGFCRGPVSLWRPQRGDHQGNTRCRRDCEFEGEGREILNCLSM